MSKWQNVVATLKDLGYTQKRIADAVGCDQSHISDLRTGKRSEPRYSLGEKLLALLEEAKRGDREAA